MHVGIVSVLLFFTYSFIELVKNYVYVFDFIMRTLV